MAARGYFQTSACSNLFHHSNRSALIRARVRRSFSIQLCGILDGSSCFLPMSRRWRLLSGDSQETCKAADIEAPKERRSTEGSKSSKTKAKREEPRQREGGRAGVAVNQVSYPFSKADGKRGCSFSSRPNSIRVPGADAGTYIGRQLFRSFFRHLLG